MKTKIIYISGNEVFEMSEIRAAFDEVRDALGLDKDTILFGVPVDSDNALANKMEDSAYVTAAAVAPVLSDDVHQDTPQQEEQRPIEIPVISETNSETVAEYEHAEITEVLETESADDIVDATEDIEEIVSVEAENTEDKVIPILSILGGTHEETQPEVTEPVSETAPMTTVEVTEDATTQDIPQEIIAEVNIDAPLMAPVMEDTGTQDAEIEQVTIGDMIDEEAPAAPMEKTLEQLLESMTPLREDIVNNQIEDTADAQIEVLDDNDTDATLAQLASEFAENEDKIPSVPKAEHQGKIGKLKNILPFKKAKRDDGGLMGDLFGWAGIAANDEDFSIPGFFANAKKQGA